MFSAMSTKAVWIEVAHSDCTHFACLQCLLHGAISAVVVAEWLVDEQQVDVVGAELAQALVNACRCLLLAGIRKSTPLW